MSTILLIPWIIYGYKHPEKRFFGLCQTKKGLLILMSIEILYWIVLMLLVGKTDTGTTGEGSFAWRFILVYEKGIIPVWWLAGKINPAVADKVDADGWLKIHETAHRAGMHSNATLLFGHIEKYHHRIDHMRRLRELQDGTHGFNTFIPLKFRNKDNDMSNVAESSLVEDMKMYAISRIYLDNFPHIKAYWPMLGRQNAQLSLSFGVNDIDGTIDDTTKIYSMAGSEEQTPAMNTAQLVTLIKQAKRRPVERGTLYNVIHDYTDTDFTKESTDPQLN